VSRWWRLIVAHKAVAAILTAVVLLPVSGMILSRFMDGRTAVVGRVIDGDTLDVEYGGATRRVRLLNVDTPETVDPGNPVQCLGPEAAEFLRQRLPAGSTIRVRFDQDRYDRYGRELAAVFAQRSLINAEIARAGFGVAVLYEPNDRFYAPVLSAQRDAERRQIGLHSPDSGCTP
jgi:micrococcal nuclease